MIYETIPAKYLDHSELFQTMHEGFNLKLMYDNQADTLVDKLMTVDSSGDAFKMGKCINVFKNCSEQISDQGGYLIEFIEKFKLEKQLNTFEYDVRAFMDSISDENKRISPVDVLQNWIVKVLSVLNKYDSDRFVLRGNAIDFGNCGIFD